MFLGTAVSGTNGIHLRGPGIYPIHCHIDGKGGAYTLVIDPTSVTLVNGTPVERCVLNEGDVISVGEARLRFSLQAADEQVAPAPPVTPARASPGHEVPVHRPGPTVAQSATIPNTEDDATVMAVKTTNVQRRATLRPKTAPPAAASSVSRTDGAGGADRHTVPASQTAPQVGPAKLQKSIALVERYITMNHPSDPMSAILGDRGTTKPEYRPAAGGNILRGNHLHIDMKIVSVAQCLKGGRVNATDVDAHNRKAMEAIQHYASLEKVRAFFLLPYYARRGVIVQGRPIEPSETCRLYAGFENLLLEIYEELPEGGVITDEVVERKIDSLADSIN
jgi:hypothetical protein